MEKKIGEEHNAASLHIRLGAVAFAAAGVLFVLYPVIRPFSDEASLLGAEAFASMEWMNSHVAAIFAFILLSAGWLGLNLSLQASSAKKLATRSLLLSWFGIGLTLPFYGAEVFSLYAIGREAVRQQNPQLMSLAGDIRFGPGFYMILAGLALLAIGAVMAAIAVWTSRLLSKWSAVPFAIGLLSYLPQYTATQPVRIAHGFLIAIGCLWIAAGLWRHARRSSKHSLHHRLYR
ncbi:hypothetical protein [Paenibacillus soyae]|uniref:DUF4386 family protein n=1 Tax=Paenibacillus soyae TaxID=2969249 RepID=A0A9X2MQ94_9BACL|nr:hypothetical protein [Paenibacillus soyae]MCR2803883.1 hypothetical protein [Paenibacillus soyae]